MKIKTKVLDYDRVMGLPRPEHKDPTKPNIFWRSIIRVAAIPDLLATRFTFTTSRMELVDGPCLILMNHSCFLDLEIAYRIFYPKPLCIVCTSDGFVGKDFLMRWIGCIPTQKFVSDVQLIRDMTYALKEKNTSVLMYPEASYTFDGTATPLPRKMGVLLKKLDVPVVMVTTQGAFARQPLYNGLRKRKVKVSAHVECLLTREEIREGTVAELSKKLDDAFVFDGFAWQQESGVEIDTPTRAEGLSRILFRCPHCGQEGHMTSTGIGITCTHCGVHYEMTPLGKLKCTNAEAKFTHIPHWYAWERDMVRREILDGTYRLDVDVDIGMMVDYKAIYMVGAGHLTHDREGFHLTGCDGKLTYDQKPLACYGLYSDYYWYEIADVICIGNHDCLYYCFPKGGDVVSKARMAAEELYKLAKARKLPAPAEASL